MRTPRRSPLKINRNDNSSISISWYGSVIRWILLLLSLIWLFTVFKVFLLEKKVIEPLAIQSLSSSILIPDITNSGNSNFIKGLYIARNDISERKLSSNSKSNIVLPSSTEWLAIRSQQNYKIGGEFHSTSGSIPEQSNKIIIPNSIINSNSNSNSNSNINSNSNAVSNNGVTKKAWELEWPPVLPDTNLPSAAEGYDTLKLTGLQVPRFWEGRPGEDLNKVGSKVNGEETIFLMIASYRDFQCRETIASAFNKADHPERLFIGAVDQVSEGDTGCLDLEVPCSEDPNRRICQYWNQISVYKVKAELSTGPVTARHIGDRMYRGQYYVMQMDAHCLFVRHWDTKLIDQWKSTHNEMAVLSSYLTDIQGSIDGNGDSKRDTRPIMCNSDFEGQMPARYLRHGAQPEDYAAIKDMPQLQPFWAAGFSFSRSHFKLRVPYDPYQPMVFQGEEIAIGIRGFTYGYDFYAPRDSVVFHEYAEKSSRRKKIHMFWENSNSHVGEGQRSLRRGTAVIGMAPDIDASTYDHSELDKYGLGTVRTTDQFYKLFLINVHARKAVQLCPFVKDGMMHREFQKYLRPDGLGIDYTKLTNYEIPESKRNKKNIFDT